MAFTATFGVSNDPKNKISKSVTNTVSYTCTVKDEGGINVMTPSLLVSAGDDIVSKNYVYIPNFKRYYFIASLNAGPNGLWLCDLKEDVLMSFKTGIMASDVMLNRSADFRNYFLQDNILPVTNRTLTWTRVFPNSPFKGSVNGAIVTILGTNDN